jgi:hypothetical protein
MPIRHPLLVCLLLLMVGCAATSDEAKPDWTTATGSDIPASTTFGWIDEFSAAPSSILDNQISTALRNEFVKKGYAESTDSPDLVISYETMEIEKVKPSNPVRIGFGVGSWGGSGGGSVGSSVDVGGDEEVLLQHQMVVRVLDPETDQEVWIGTTTTFDEHPDDAVISTAVVELMQGFPAKRP